VSAHEPDCPYVYQPFPPTPGVDGARDRIWGVSGIAATEPPDAPGRFRARVEGLTRAEAAVVSQALKELTGAGWVRFSDAMPPGDRRPFWVYNEERGAVVAYLDPEYGAVFAGPLFEATNGHGLPMEFYPWWRPLEDPGKPESAS
jgi:hypothetical protein